MNSDSELPLTGSPRSQDEAFRAGLWGAPYCNVDDFEVAAVPYGVTPHIPSRPTIFVGVDFIGPHQEKYLPTTYWAYDAKLELEECYRIGRVMRFIFWLFDVADLSESRARVLGTSMMQAAKLQVEKHRDERVAHRYDSKKSIQHFRRVLEQTTDFKQVGRSSQEIETDLAAYAARVVEGKVGGPFALTVESGEPFKKWKRKREQ
jgi:hypothetical protein